MDSELYVLFKKSDLIPAVVVEDSTGEVLMLAYMNDTALGLTLKTKRTHFYSRSRKRIWNKGETSGHFQDVVAIYADCDYDTLLVRVNQTGVACHTGEKSCFFNKIL